MTRSGSGTIMCDSCDKRIRTSAHELRVSDATTGQHLGIYHAPECQHAASKYATRGVVLRFEVVHPNRCGYPLHFLRCDCGLSELAPKR